MTKLGYVVLKAGDDDVMVVHDQRRTLAKAIMSAKRSAEMHMTFDEPIAFCVCPVFYDKTQVKAVEVSGTLHPQHAAWKENRDAEDRVRAKELGIAGWDLHG